ncbi:MAG: dipeptidase [Bacteroidota bacterium]
MINQLKYFAFSVVLLSSCVKQGAKTNLNEQAMRQKANEIAHKYVLVDGHVDLPYRLKIKNFRLEKEFTGIPLKSSQGDFDFERAQKGGLSSPMMSIYIPSKYDKEEAGYILADSLINLVNWIADENPNYFKVAKSPDEIIAIKNSGKIALPMGMENGSPMKRLEDIKYFKNRGISYVTLTHGKDNHICDSSYDSTKTWHGLSPYGELFVKELAKNGVMIDISHVSDETFYDVIKIAPVPIIASHSSVRYFTPGFQRNMNDDMIKELGKKNGVIMVNFGSTFLDSTVAKKRSESTALLNKLLKSKGLIESDEAAKPVIAEFTKTNPAAFADVEMVADHIDRIVKLSSINQVGFGSDFDGVGDSLPTGLKDVADYPNLLYVLLKRGYTEDDLAKMCSGNIFRVWNEVLAFAKK